MRWTGYGLGRDWVGTRDSERDHRLTANSRRVVCLVCHAIREQCHDCTGDAGTVLQTPCRFVQNGQIAFISPVGLRQYAKTWFLLIQRTTSGKTMATGLTSILNTTCIQPHQITHTHSGLHFHLGFSNPART